MYVCLRIHLEINHSFIKVINTPKIAQAATQDRASIHACAYLVQARTLEPSFCF